MSQGKQGIVLVLVLAFPVKTGFAGFPIPPTAQPPRRLSIANTPIVWTAAGSETPRRFRPREKVSNVQKPAARSKAVSRLRLATALQDVLQNAEVTIDAKRQGTRRADREAAW